MFSLFLECGQEEKDFLIADLWERGSNGITETDLPDGRCELRAFFENEPAGMPGARVEHEPPRDWTAVARAKLQPLSIGSRFFLVPAWRDDPTPDGRIRIEIDPGQAFGTGHHETTQLCLEALESEVNPRMRVMDLGTGTGILALGARLLGAGSVVGCDTDAVACGIAQRLLAVFTGSVDAVKAASIDLVIANITGGVLTVLAPELRRVLKPGGILIASGFETHETGGIAAAIETCGGAVREVRSKNTWSCVTAQF